MRALRLVVVSLLVVTGIAVGGPAAYADNNASLGVSPGHGGPTDQFTAILRFQASKHGKNRQCAPEQVTFSWDGAALGTAVASPAGDVCVATLRATPPAGVYQDASNHIVGVSGVRDLRARYTVVAAAAAAQPTPSAAPTATPENTPTFDAQTTDPVTASAGTGLAAPAVGAKTSDPGGLTGVPGWLVALGTLLFLAGAGTFGAMIWRARRAKTEDLLDPTQPLPIPLQPGAEYAPESRTAQLRPPT